MDVYRGDSVQDRPGQDEAVGAELMTVGEVAAKAHVSVRTLHHYDEIGLLSPTKRSGAGYRLYDATDQERLHQILLFRELGLNLEAIRGALDASDPDRLATLVAQKRALERRRRRTDAVIQAVDRAIETIEKGGTMNDTELFEGFDAFDHAQYAEEAKERWGDTDAHRESERRTREYGRKDWAAMKAEGDGIVTRMAELMTAGADPVGAEAMGVAEEHRRHIDRWFYPCSPQMHSGLADMYEADSRFGEYFEKRGSGLTPFFSAAVRANAARVEAG